VSAGQADNQTGRQSDNQNVSLSHCLVVLLTRRGCSFRGALVIPLALALSGCGDLLWGLAHSSPAMERLSDRMNERGFERHFSGDPLKELEWNCKNGEFGFQGIQDRDSVFGVWGRCWVPGITDKALPFSEISGYQGCVHSTPWRAAAIRYFTTYNRRLLLRKRDKTLKEFDPKVDAVIAGAKSTDIRSTLPINHPSRKPSDS
jgi:hypothetical protein